MKKFLFFMLASFFCSQAFAGILSEKSNIFQTINLYPQAIRNLDNGRIYFDTSCLKFSNNQLLLVTPFSTTVLEELKSDEKGCYIAFDDPIIFVGHCNNCNFEWTTTYGNVRFCPRCHSDDVSLYLSQ